MRAYICTFCSEVLSIFFLTSYKIELGKRKLKAQEKGDLTEEAKLCNAVGELLSQYGKKMNRIKCEN